MAEEFPNDPTDTRIFVFGSNLAGRHGAGAAKWAMDHRGAIYGRGIGCHGQSYAIPTKDRNIETMPVYEIRRYVHTFIDFAKRRTDLRFQLTPIGCGLAGYTPNDIAPLFAEAPWNVDMPDEFRAWFAGAGT